MSAQRPKRPGSPVDRPAGGVYQPRSRGLPSGHSPGAPADSSGVNMMGSGVALYLVLGPRSVDAVDRREQVCDAPSGGGLYLHPCFLHALISPSSRGSFFLCCRRLIVPPRRLSFSPSSSPSRSCSVVRVALLSPARRSRRAGCPLPAVSLGAETCSGPASRAGR